ncbi:MAG: hypothetical protein LBJ38_03545, partial [Oscillospiraceae bacterium]|nr:hypothetical protein [Oscillospiraceae bacterium]
NGCFAEALFVLCRLGKQSIACCVRLVCSLICVVVFLRFAALFVAASFVAPPFYQYPPCSRDGCFAEALFVLCRLGKQSIACCGRLLCSLICELYVTIELSKQTTLKVKGVLVVGGPQVACN